MNYTFHWHQAFQALPSMLGGALVTIQIAVLSMVLGTLFGIALALARNTKSRVARGSLRCGSRRRATRRRCFRST